MQDRPIIPIEKDNLMKAAQMISFLAVIVSWALALYYYNKFPESIPIHFDAAGNPNSFGARETIFLLPVIATILVLGMNWLAKYPHIFNYGQKVTEQNAAKLYKASVKMLYVVNAVAGFILMITVISTCAAVFNEGHKMDSWALPVILVLSGVLIVYSIMAAVKSARIK